MNAAIFLACTLGIVVFLRRVKRAGNRELEATDYYCLMRDLFRDLCDDPCMSSRKWKEWLPLFQDADDRFAETHPYVKNFYRYAEAVKEKMTTHPSGQSAYRTSM